MKKLFLFILLTLFIINLNAQSTDFPFKEKWAEIDSVLNLNQPKTATELLKIFKEAAIKEKQTGYYVLSIEKEINLKSQLNDENSDSAKWYLIKSEIDQVALKDALPFLYLIGAKYLRYKYDYTNFYDDKIANDHSSDWNDWSGEKLVYMMNGYLMQAQKLTSHSSFVNLRLNVDNKLSPLIINYEIAEFKYTIEQMVLLQSIEIAQGISLNKTKDYLALSAEKTLVSQKDFLREQFVLNEDPNNDYFVLRMFQELLERSQLEDNGTAIWFNLMRLNFAKQFDNSTDKQFWLTALETLLEKEKTNPNSNLIANEIAQYYSNTNPSKARTIAKNALKLHPDFKYNDRLTTIIEVIEKPDLSLETESIIEPEKPILAKLSYKNVTSVYVEVYKINYLEHYHKFNYNWGAYKYLDTLLSVSKSFSSYEIKVPTYGDYKSHSSEIAFKSLPKGQYVFKLSNSKDSINTQYIFSQIVQVSEYTVNQQNGYYNYILLDAKDGEIEENTPFTVYSKKTDDGNTSIEKIYTSKTNKHGLIDLGSLDVQDYYRNLLVEVEGGEYYHELNYYRPQPNETPIAQKVYYNINLFTDRNIYRPGQTVYFKGIVYNYRNHQIIAGDTINVSLKDGNGQTKKEIALVSNEFGSVAGSIVLPSGGINTGRFYVQGRGSRVNPSEAYFNVEEYKRPKYSVEITEPKTAFKLNDSVTLEGKAMAFAGYAVQNAKVAYTVARSLKPKYYWWGYRGMPYSNSDEVVLATEETKTDNQGKFEINFKASPDETVSTKENPYFIYSIKATVTDLNGEVRMADYSLTLAYTDLQLVLNGEQKYLKNEPIKLNLQIQNLQGKLLSKNATLQIEKLIETDKPKRKKLWSEADTVAMIKAEYEKLFPDYAFSEKDDYTFISKTELVKFNKESYTLPALTNVGTYKATVTTADGNGKTITESFTFEVTPNKKGKYKQPKTLDLIVLNGQNFEPGESAKFLIASGVETEVTLIVSSFRGEIINKRIKLCKKAKLIEIPITEEDRGNISIHAFTTHNYRFYHEQEMLTVPYSNKKLNYSIKSIRDKTEPGVKETWILSIKGNDANRIYAEHLASMYDKSLDALAGEHQYTFFPYKSYNSYPNFRANFETVASTDYYFFQKDNFYAKSLIEPYFLFNGYSWGFGSGAGSGYRYTSYDIMNGVIGREANGALQLSKSNSLSDSEYEEESIPETSKPQTTPPPIRSNFNETAFFFPQMLTNEEGDLVLEFTMPESLTQWKLMLLGHTKDLKISTLTKSITTSKKVMVQPNVPRFLREQDTIVLSAKLVNTTGQNLETNVKFDLTDAITGKKLNWTIAEQKLSFNLLPNSSESLTFELAIPNYNGLVNIAFSATAGEFTDGEMHTVPVLTNRKLITETLPITVTEKGTQNLTFTSLKKNKSTTLSNHKLSIELTSNPAWYAVQSLPYLIEFPHECAEQTFSRLYANLVANHITQSNPAIIPMIKNWEQAGEKDSNILLSNLEKNQDLKYTVLSETPWLLEAQNETAQKQHLAQLFNAERIEQSKSNAFERLKQLQNSNGGWGWFDGMQANTYITQTIVIGFGKMEKMGIDISQYEDIINNAIVYLDNDAQRLHNEYLKNKEKGITFEPTNLQYLYCKSYFPNEGFTNDNKVVQYFITNAEKNWTTVNLINQAQLVKALQTLKPNSKIPNLIIKSLTENAQNTKEMGMYWKQNRAGYYWNQAPIETQAAIIEAYTEMKADPKLIMQQQNWLLRQKQTQNWKTTRATADACYALMIGGADLLNSPLQLEATINTTRVSTTKGEPGTGYIRTTIPVSEINKQSANVTVTASSDNFGYGAVYWQYFENLDKIKSTSSGIYIEKKIYKITNTPTGEKRVLISAKDSLQIGDRIEVLLSVSTDRNLEFLHIKDLRGSGTEPMAVISGYKWNNGAGFYQTTLDASTNFFVDYLSKGNYQFTYQLTVQQAGSYNCGLATVQCMYAPEFVGNSKSIKVSVGK